MSRNRIDLSGQRRFGIGSAVVEVVDSGTCGIDPREGDPREGDPREGDPREGEAREGEAREGEAREGEAPAEPMSSEFCGSAGALPFRLHNRIRRNTFAIASWMVLALAGCGDDVPSASSTTGSATPAGSASAESRTQKVKSSGDGSDPAAAAESQDKFEFKPLALNGIADSAVDSTGSGSEADPEKRIQTIISRLQPLQILLGQWRGTTRRDYENFKAVDIHEWVWDLRSDPAHPALTIQSDKSPYIRTGRLTWDMQQNRFAMTISDPAGTVREFSGDFTEPVHEIVGSDDKLHKVFRLEFDQTEDGARNELWQLAFAQQESNRYLLEVGKRRGKADFARFDTVSTQREGTSFAVSDVGYAEKTCIISEGLGTMEVTWKGRSYWVCCTGCKAAFEEDPETWIARAAKKEAPK